MASIAIAVILMTVWVGAYLVLLIPSGPVQAGDVNGLAVISAAVVTTAIVTFFGFLRVSGTAISNARLRFTIAGSTVVTYLVFVGAASLFQTGGELPESSRILLTSFTTTVGVIIAFYFGSSAYVRVRSGQDKNDPPSTR